MFRTSSFISKKYLQNYSAPQLYNYYSVNYTTSSNNNGSNDGDQPKKKFGLFGARREQSAQNSQSSQQKSSENESSQQSTSKPQRSLFGNKDSGEKRSLFANRSIEQKTQSTDSANGKPQERKSLFGASKGSFTSSQEGSQKSEGRTNLFRGSLFGKRAPSDAEDSASSTSNRETKPTKSLFNAKESREEKSEGKDENAPRKSLFSNVGLFGKPRSTRQEGDTATEEQKVRRPLFSSVSSPFAKPATGPEKKEQPADIVGKDPKTPVQLEKGIPKTSMYGVEHDDKLKREIERARLLRSRTQEQLKSLAQKANVIQKHRHWKNIDTDTLRKEIFKNYNQQRYDMLKPLLDLVEEVEELEKQSQENNALENSVELQTLDNEVNAFLNKNPKIKEISSNRLNPWTLIDDPKLAKQILNKNTLESYGYNLLNKLEEELKEDSAAERTILGFLNINEIRNDKKDYEAFQFASELINTNIPEDDVAKDEWEQLKEDMARVLDLDLQDMKGKRLLTMEPLSHELNHDPIDHLQTQAKSFFETLKQKTQRDDVMALESFKLRQEEEDSLIKALRSRDKIALLGDPHGGSLIGFSNHILVYESQMKQIIRDHNKRLRLLNNARNKYSEQTKIHRIENTASLVHVGKLKNKQVIAPLYKYVERFVDRIPESLAKRRLASHARIIMKNRYLTLEEKKTMIGNLAQVYHKYRLHLHMTDVPERPKSITHIHNEIRRFGGL